MKSLTFIFLLTLLSLSNAQSHKIDHVPLPEKFDGMKEDIEVMSSPNPNFAEFTPENNREIVWKHSTTIKANSNIKIVEVGAFLLEYGEWSLRASFDSKTIKKLFNTKNLNLVNGDQIVFEKNNRYGNYTQTGWSLWYVIAVDEKGNNVFGYEALETRGETVDGQQVLPLTHDTLGLNWSGSSADNSYVLGGTVQVLKGTLVIKKGGIESGDLDIDMTSIDSDNASLTAHLKTPDFFSTEKFPKASFRIEQAVRLKNGQFRCKGTFELLGIQNLETFDVALVETKTHYRLNIKVSLDRTKYGIDYMSGKESDEKASELVSNIILIEGALKFEKDYEGSTPWNSFQKKE